MAHLTDKQFKWVALGVLVGVPVLYFAGKKMVTGAVSGIATGDNAVTEGTVYEGKGIIGTLGAVTNELSGGTLERFGNYLGQKTFEYFGPEPRVSEAQKDKDYTTVMTKEGIRE